jgi:16S rRNA (cytosine967-C5)-methyltransferase
VDATRPGGVVAYCTCSPHPSETRGVVDALLASRADVEVIDARDALSAVGALPSPLPDQPMVQLWTHRHGTDSMFISLLRRRVEGDTAASGR